MKQNQLVNSIFVIIFFLIAIYGNRFLSSIISIEFSSEYLSTLNFYSWWLIPIFIVTLFLFGHKNTLKVLGIDKGFIQGILFATITVSPMLISSAFLGEFSKNTNLFLILKTTFFAGLFEELLFRGFLFGILFRKLGWGFIPASLLGAMFFGLGHLYQGSTLFETLGIFAITAMGAAWFSWLYIEWNNNLWIPIFLHSFMNLSWVLFEVSDNALGSINTNFFRIITIALSIIITIIRFKKHGLKINKVNLLVNKQIL